MIRGECTASDASGFGDPAVIWFGARRVEVRAVTDRWFGSDQRWWKVETADGIYIARRQSHSFIVASSPLLLARARSCARRLARTNQAIWRRVAVSKLVSQRCSARHPAAPALAANDGRGTASSSKSVQWGRPSPVSDVLDEAVAMDIKLPRMLGLLAGAVKSRLQRSGQLLLK